MTGAAGASPPAMVRCNMLRRWHAALAGGRVERVMSLAIWAICFCVAKIANDCIGIVVIAKRVAPCARRGLAAQALSSDWLWIGSCKMCATY
jgi:hypothetical protein